MCTYLFNVQPSELKGPLVQFQATQTTQDDTLKLLGALNRALGEMARPSDQLERLFKQWWPTLEAALKFIPTETGLPHHQRSESEILEELLELARQQIKLLTLGGVTTGYHRPLEFMDKDAIMRFSREVRLSGSAGDLNAENWAPAIFERYAESSFSFLDGKWASRWNESGSVWQTGAATIAIHGQYFSLIHTDSQFEYLMLGWIDGDRLLGYHYNPRKPSDSSPWVGVVVDKNRIDGQWRHGRWDLRRCQNG